MRIRVQYTIDVSMDDRWAINAHYGISGPANRETISSLAEQEGTGGLELICAEYASKAPRNRRNP